MVFVTCYFSKCILRPPGLLGVGGDRVNGPQSFLTPSLVRESGKRGGQVCHETPEASGEHWLLFSWGLGGASGRRLKLGLDTQGGLEQEEGNSGDSRQGEGQRAGCGRPSQGWSWQQHDVPGGSLRMGPLRAVAGKVARRCLGGLKCPAQKCGLALRPHGCMLSRA